MDLYTNGHFFGKFDNVDASNPTAMLGGYEAQPGDLLALTKKPSGSLLTVQPYIGITSKNSARGPYHQVMSYALSGVLGLSGKTLGQLMEFCTNESVSVCCELVVPHFLGDHGATPNTGFFVVTAIMYDHKPLPPWDVLDICGEWGLPVNESFFIPHAHMCVAEQRLLADRFRMSDSDVPTLFEGFQEEVVHVGSLFPQSILQGELLEGFVAMWVKSDLDRIRSARDLYDNRMRDITPRIIAFFKETGEFLHDAEAEDIPSQPTFRHIGPLSLPVSEQVVSTRTPNSRLVHELGAFYPEAVRFPCYETGYKADEAANLSGRELDAELRLRNLSLEGTEEEKRTRLAEFPSVTVVFVHGTNDNVFYDHGLHQLGEDLPQLYRCHTLRNCKGPPQTRTVDSKGFQVIAMVKIKTRYIRRTFGCRNLLEGLYERGLSHYMRCFDRMLSIWRVPADLHREWRQEALTHAEYFLAQEEPVTSGNYLRVLDKFAPLPPPPPHAIVVCNFTGTSIPNPSSFAAAHFPHHRAKPPGRDALRPGQYVIVEVPPPPVTHPDRTLLIVLPPPEDKAVPPSFAKRHESTMRRFAEGSFGPLRLTELDGVASAPADFEPLPEPELESPEVRVVLFPGAPPGCGKTTLAQRLYPDADVVQDAKFKVTRRNQVVIVHSDLLRARALDPDAVFKKIVAEPPFPCTVVYDKNIPSEEGMRKIAYKLCGKVEKNVRLAFVVPSSIDRELCLSRLLLRKESELGMHPVRPDDDTPAYLAENVATVFEDMLVSSQSTLLTFQQLQGAITTTLYTNAGDTEEELRVRRFLQLDAGETKAAQSTCTDSSHREVVPWGVSVADLDLIGAAAAASADSYARLDVYVEVNGRMRKSGSHLTLIRPGAKVPQAVMAAEGRVVPVRMLSYHKVERVSDQRCKYFWKADTDGLDDLPLPQSQRLVWHVTDNASGCRAAKGKMVADALNWAVQQTTTTSATGQTSTEAPDPDGAPWKFTDIPIKPFVVQGRLSCSGER
eukprot:Rmarinus@m.18625